MDKDVVADILIMQVLLMHASRCVLKIMELKTCMVAEQDSEVHYQLPHAWCY